MNLTVLSSFFVNLLKRIGLSKLKKIRDNWGAIPENAVDIETAELYFELNKQNSIDNCYRIDDDTWYDLDLDELFALINRTTSPTGAQYLFYLLRHPVFEKRILDNRQELIKAFSNNRELREAVQLALHSLAERNAKYLPYSLWKPLPENPDYARVFPILTFIAPAVFLLYSFQLLPFAAVVTVFIIYMAIHYLVKRRLDVFLASFQYLGVLISVAEKIQALPFPELRSVQNTLMTNLKDTLVISRKIYTLSVKDSTGLGEFLKIYFLSDISGFYSALGNIKAHLQELRKLFEIVGYLDSLISVASFRLEYQHFCQPVFKEDNYSVEDIYNPLLEKPVTNSFPFDVKNIIITGSNMAGKTTFLKTLGVNAILAQTINMSMAKRYQAPFFKVISSIGSSDNLTLAKSYYLAEVESILRLIQASKSDTIHLFIIDEIFRGTNSVERLAASVEVLKYLVNGKDYTLIATHDLQLTELLDGNHRNFHFRESVSKEGLSFDYKLHSGSSKTRNAIALLEYAGYPNKIVENATKRITNSST